MFQTGGQPPQLALPKLERPGIDTGLRRELLGRQPAVLPAINTLPPLVATGGLPSHLDNEMYAHGPIVVSDARDRTDTFGRGLTVIKLNGLDAVMKVDEAWTVVPVTERP